MSRERPQTGLKKGDDGRFKVWCRICPRRQWRNLRPDERVEVWFDTAKEAKEQGKRHRASDFHLNVVARLASNEPTHEERVLAAIFGRELLDTPCETCGFHHSAKLTCLTAARIRDKEGMP